MSVETDDIEQLLAAYCHAVDRGTAAEVAALFAVDGILRPYYDGDYEMRGREAIESWYAFYHENFRASVRHLKHMIMSPMITLNGDRASGVSYLLASAISNDSDEGFYVNGTYTDEFVHSDGRWYFAIRQIDVEAMFPQGKAVETFPPLNFPAS
ncbi:MAG: nuclear transport factor 2 family protein [Gammaproteobacteria bacterium]